MTGSNCLRQEKGEKCDGPVLPFEPPDTGFLELEVIAGFRVWQLAFMGVLAILALIIVLCCIFRCRIPRTKQEIEADCARKKVTRQFSSHLLKIPVDRMQLEEVLPEVITLEAQRIAKGIKEEKMTFFQKLKKTICSSGDDDEDEDSSSNDSLEKVSTEDQEESEGGPDKTGSDRLSSHQEQLAAALKKLHKIRQVQQQLQSGGKSEHVAQTPEGKRKKDDKESKSHKSRLDDKVPVKGKKDDVAARSPSRESGRESARAQVLEKQKTCPQILTETSSTEGTVSTFKRSASEDETGSRMRDKRSKRLSRQIEIREQDMARISGAREEAVYEEIAASGRQHSHRHVDEEAGKSEARTKF